MLRDCIPGKRDSTERMRDGEGGGAFWMENLAGLDGRPRKTPGSGMGS